MWHLLSAIVTLPALGALAQMGLPAGSARLRRGVALGASSLALLLSLVLWLRFEPRGVQWQFLVELTPLSFGVDGFGALILVLTTAVAWCGLLLSVASTADRAGSRAAATLVLEAAVLGAVASLNMIFFALFWSIAMSAAWWLVRTASERQSNAVGGRFGRFATVSTLALVAAIAVLAYVHRTVTGSYTFDIRMYQQITVPLTMQLVVFGLLLVAFTIASGAFPFHGAHRDAIAETAPAVWIPVAVVLATLGMYGFLRLCLPVLPDASRMAAPGLALVSIGGALFAIAVGARDPRLSRFVAGASVAQVTLLWFSLTTLTPLGVTAAMAQIAGYVAVMTMLALVVAGSHTEAVPALAKWTVGVTLAIVTASAIYPTSLLDRVETSVARVILRVSPQHAAEVSDCLTASQAPPPPPDIPGLPASATMAAPCDTSGAEKK
jgi:NADH-quinone oxidoreductase subunit M